MSLTRYLIKEHYPLILTSVFLLALIGSLVFLMSDLIDTNNTEINGELTKCSRAITHKPNGVKIWCDVKLPSGESVPVGWYGQIEFPKTFPVSVLILEKQGKSVGNKNYSLIGLQ